MYKIKIFKQIDEDKEYPTFNENNNETRTINANVNYVIKAV